MNFFKKISIVIIASIFVININIPRAHAGLADEIVGLFFDVVETIGEGIVDVIKDSMDIPEPDEFDDLYGPVMDDLETDIISELENSPTYQDIFEAAQQEDLDGQDVWFDTNGDGVIDYRDLGISTNPDGTLNSNSELDPDNPNYQNQVIISDILDRVMGELDDSGFFDEDNPYHMSFSEEEFKLLIGNILFRNIITEVIDPETQLPRGVDVESQLGIEIKMNPSYPQPGDVVQIEIVSNSVDLNKSEINWLKSGKILKSGLGATKLNNYKINSLGETEIIMVKVETERSGILDKRITIQPAYVDFYYETDTYTPPFYKGKSSFVSQSQLKVMAMPQILGVNGERLSYRDFTYKWYLNNRIIDGIKTGENSIYIQDNFYNNHLKINVLMEHLHSDLLLSKTFTLTPEEPELMFYEEDPALGIKFNRAILNQKNTSDREFSIKIIPFNFNDKNSLDYKWQLDGNLISGVFNDFITFRANGSEDINSMVSVDVQNPISITQSKSKSFNIFVNN